MEAPRKDKDKGQVIVFVSGNEDNATSLLHEAASALVLTHPKQGDNIFKIYAQYYSFYFSFQFSS